jgi:LysR family hydrogen peroxide-inducible transcriptional activator
MQLQKLEDELGVIIFDRSKNPILPTMEGERIISQGQIVVKEHKRIFDIVESSGDELSGEFKLGVIPTIAPYLIPLFAQKFTKKYPEVILKIEELTTEEILRLLETDDLDAGLLVTPLKEESLIERALYYEPFYLFTSPEHPLNKKKKIKEEDLTLDGLWLLKDGHCFRSQVLNICKTKNINSSGLLNLNFESGNFETLKRMVLSCDGYTLLPHMDVKDFRGAKKEMIKEFKSPVPTREVSLVHGRSFLKEKIIEALQSEILNVIPEELISFKKIKHTVVDIDTTSF